MWRCRQERVLDMLEMNYVAINGCQTLCDLFKNQPCPVDNPVDQNPSVLDRSIIVIMYCNEFSGSITVLADPSVGQSTACDMVSQRGPRR